MANLLPFRALYPASNEAASVCCLPHHVIARPDSRRYYEEHPTNFIRVVHAALAFPEHSHASSREIALRARREFTALLERGSMRRAAVPAFYIYEVSAEGHRQAGIVGCASLADFEQGQIVGHEHTLPSEVGYRAVMLREVGVQPGPVFLIHQASEELRVLLTRRTMAAPLAEYNAEDGTRHRIWELADTPELRHAIDGIGRIYVADGHHRIEASLMLRNQLRSEQGSSPGDQPYNYFLAAIFPHDEVKILPYHRLLKRLPRGGLEQLLAALNEHYELRETTAAHPTSKGELGLYVPGKWFLLTPRFILPKDIGPTKVLEVAMFQERILAPLFEITDQRNDPDIAFVPGMHSQTQLQQLVDSGFGACAFLLFPTSVQELVDVADAGQTVAPKSTWFEPKLACGLIVQEIIPGSIEERR